MQAECDNRPIGVFDSGLGGLTVVSALRKRLPAEDIVYLGDTARVPYGDKSVETIIRYGNEDSRFLLSKGVKAVVVACNTVSAVAIDDLREKYQVPVIGVLEAGVSACLKAAPSYVAVIGTKATVNSDAYRRSIHRENPAIVVESIACPLFVPIAEEGLTETPLAAQAVSHYLGHLKAGKPDLLLLGCTHYPLLTKHFEDLLPECRVLDSAESCASYTETYLMEHKLAASPRKNGSERFYVTDLSSDFYAQASRFFGQRIRHVEKVSLS